MKSPLAVEIFVAFCFFGVTSAFWPKCGFDQWMEWPDKKHSDSPMFILTGHLGETCLAVTVRRSLKVTFDVARRKCEDNFVGGRLMTKYNVEAFQDEWQRRRPENFDTKFLMEGSFGTKCAVIQLKYKEQVGKYIAGIDHDDQHCHESNSFICEYPRSTSCKYEMMTDSDPVFYNGYYVALTKVIQTQQNDDTNVKCNEDNLERRNALAGDVAMCGPLFDGKWTEWGECEKCLRQGQRSSDNIRVRTQGRSDECKRVWPTENVTRFHIKPCPDVPNCPGPQAIGENSGSKVKILLTLLVIIAVSCIVINFI